MSKYEVYYHPIRKFSTIKRGFIWPAFFFGPAWLFYRKCWFEATALAIVIFVWLLLLGVPKAFVLSSPGRGYSFLLNYLLAGWWPYLPIGFLGSKCVVHNLKNRGFTLIGKYECKTGDAALALLHRDKLKRKTKTN